MTSYFEAAKNVLLKAGVAVVNPHYDPNLPYSQEILITKPARICSYDETKMELDSTRGFKGRNDKTIRNSPEDDGTMISTKSDKCASAVCGRLGDGKALPVFMCYASGDSYKPAWAPLRVCEGILDKTSSHSLGDTSTMRRA